MMGFLPDGWLPRRSLADDRRLFDDNGDAIRVPGSQDRPDDARPDVGRYEPPEEAEGADPELERVRAAQAEYLCRTVLPPAPPPGDISLTVDNRTAVFTRAEADDGATNHRPDFPEPPDCSRRARGAVARIDAVLDENLRAAIDHGRTVELERDTALARVAELELTLKALGRFVVHAAKHDTEGGA